jgi:hypothetical protein
LHVSLYRFALYRFPPPHTTINLYPHAAKNSPANTHKTRGLTIAASKRSIRHPVAAACKQPIIVAAVKTASTHPIGCAIKLRTKSPFAALANAVVMPHVMQGLPKLTIHPQGGSPSCVCVAIPFAAGVSPAANTNGVAAKSATSKHTPRCLSDSITLRLSRLLSASA